MSGLHAVREVRCTSFTVAPLPVPTGHWDRPSAAAPGLRNLGAPPSEKMRRDMGPRIAKRPAKKAPPFGKTITGRHPLPLFLWRSSQPKLSAGNFSYGCSREGEGLKKSSNKWCNLFDLGAGKAFSAPESYRGEKRKLGELAIL